MHVKQFTKVIRNREIYLAHQKLESRRCAGRKNLSSCMGIASSNVPWNGYGTVLQWANLVRDILQSKYIKHFMAESIASQHILKMANFNMAHRIPAATKSPERPCRGMHSSWKLHETETTIFSFQSTSFNRQKRRAYSLWNLDKSHTIECMKLNQEILLFFAISLWSYQITYTCHPVAGSTRELKFMSGFCEYFQTFEFP